MLVGEFGAAEELLELFVAGTTGRRDSQRLTGGLAPVPMAPIPDKLSFLPGECHLGEDSKVYCWVALSFVPNAVTFKGSRNLSEVGCSLEMV